MQWKGKSAAVVLRMSANVGSRLRSLAVRMAFEIWWERGVLEGAASDSRRENSTGIPKDTRSPIQYVADNL